MIRWMCNSTLKDKKPSSKLRERLGLDSIKNYIKRGGLRWLGHVERCSDDGMVKKCRDNFIEGNKERVDLVRLGIKLWVVISED